MQQGQAAVRVAVLGTGIMGAPIARHLQGAGFDVAVWNRSADKSGALAADGCHAVASPAAAVRDAAFVVVMLSTGPVVDEILLDPETRSALAPGSIVIVMSSIPVESARHQATVLATRGVAYIDAPVSGGERGALAGTLTIMAGGDAASVTAAAAVFAPLGRVTHVGPVGSGQLAKLANQLIVGVTIGAVAEALLLAEAGGADPVAVRAALLGGFADSTILRQHGERMTSRNFAPGAKSEIQDKDMRTAAALGDNLGIALPLTKCAGALYADFCRNGGAQLDHSALYLHMQQLMSRR